MHKLTLEQYLRRGNFPFQNLDNNQEQVGLFTFYKQQEESQNTFRTHLSRKKKTRNKANTKPKLKNTREEKSLKQEQKQQLRELVCKVRKNSSPFLKNVELKMNKAQNQIPLNQQVQKNSILDNEKIQNRVPTSFGSTNLQKPAEVKKYNLELNPLEAFVSKPLTKIQQLFQLNDRKSTMMKQKYKIAKSAYLKKLSKRINSVSIQQQSMQAINNLTQVQTPSINQAKILSVKVTQQEAVVNSFQRQFLKKLRDQSIESPEEKWQKPISGSKNIENLHKENKKYFSNLINNYYLYYNKNNQAAKILKEALKFPNLYLKSSNEKMKTEETLSYSSIKRIKNQHRSVSCQKGAVSVSTNPSKEITQLAENRLKSNPNERFEILAKKKVNSKT